MSGFINFGKKSESTCRPSGNKGLAVLIAAACLLGAAPSQALDFSGVPGEALDYYELHYSWGHSAPDEFISDPAIAALANGNYLALHAYAGWNPSQNHDTKVFISTNKGQNWSYITTLSDIFTASIFQKDNGDIYLFGIKESGGKEIVCKSTDGGTNWTYSAEFATAGHFTPDRPVIHDGYIHTGGNTKTICAPENADWMLESSWTFGGGFPPPKAEWLTGTAKIEEAQAIAIPDKGLFIMTRVNDYPYSPIARVEPSNGWSCFDPAHNYIRLPGGEKKFGAAYDPISGKAFVVSNPVLPTYPGSEPHNMVRNTGAILSSRDMINWKMEKLYVFSENWDVDGFGYANFDFDGDDMVIATRTAFPVPGEDNPDRGHDSNILGYFKVPGFRTLVPDQYLKIEGNSIKRYERTQYQDAPLGTFELGVSLNTPSQLGQDSNGDVYIQDSGGIKQFDASGNFLGTVASAPVSLQPTQIDVNQPADGACSWIHSGSGDWSDPLNWYYWNRADTSEDIAVFGSAATAPTTVDIPSDSREWLFETDGNIEGWTLNNFGSSAVSNGAFYGTPSSGDPQIYRTDQSFYAADVPSIVVRMRADSASAVVGLYWGTGSEITFAGDKYISTTYTGDGEFQDVVFHLAGHAKWDGQVVARLRIDPLNGPLIPVEIDSITVKKETTHMKGLRFASAQPYTLSGGGALSIDADTGTGTIDIQQGTHTIDLPVTLEDPTDFHAETDALLRITAELDLNGEYLAASGTGKLVVENGTFQMDGGSLTVGEGSSVLFSNTLFQFDGVVEFAAPQNFNPSNGDSFHIIEGNATESMFGQLVFPTLEDGLGWDTSALYASGDISVTLKAPASWMATYGFAEDGSDDFIDSDGDGYDNYSEWKAGTNPTNALSFFDFDPAGTMPVPTGIQLRWNSLTDRTYRVESGTNLLDNPAFTLLMSGIPGMEGTTDFIDTSATNKNQGYYRVYVE
ncbi:MAG: sialidase family protein [Verrucomicrobiota bacterium]|nr:sialidase family protein [Verrucomicrobiota bacterium]